MASRDASSAHCRSSTTISPGRSPATSATSAVAMRVQEPRPRGRLVVERRRRATRPGGRGRPPAAGRRAARSRAGSATAGRPVPAAASARAKPARSSSTIGAYAIVPSAAKARAARHDRRPTRRPTRPAPPRGATCRSRPRPRAPRPGRRAVAAPWAASKRGQLRVAPDHRQASGSHGQGGDVGDRRRPRTVGSDRRRDRRARHAAGRRRLGVPDRLVQVGRLRQRRDAQLALEDGDAGPVLADGAASDRRPARAAPSADAERVRPADRGRRGATLRRSRRDMSPAASAVVASRSSTSPTNRSTATARVARQSSKSGLSRSENPARNGPRASDAARRRPAWSPDPAAASSADRSTWILAPSSGHGRPAGDDPPPAERGAQDGQRATERAPRGLVVRLGPQHRGQLVPGVRPALDAQEDEDRDGLAGVDDERRTIDPDVDGSEDADLEPMLTVDRDGRRAHVA